MTIFNRFACLAILVSGSAAAQQRELIVQTGLESDTVFEEAPSEATKSEKTPFGTKRPAAVRVFRPSASGQLLVDESLCRAEKALATVGPDQPLSQDQFIAWAKKSDPASLSLLAQSRPVLFFKFIGQSGREYILKSITANIFRADPYEGGDFTDGTAWYDIHLPIEGQKIYPVVNNALRFTGSGEAKLRFWGDAPRDPTLELAFTFIVDGKDVQVVTSPFKLMSDNPSVTEHAACPR